jgi:hypothetical protein
MGRVEVEVEDEAGEWVDFLVREGVEAKTRALVDG